MNRRRVLGSLTALAAVLGCVWLGAWQWERSSTELPGTTLTLDGAVPLSEALGPDDAFGSAEGQVPVAAVGRYDTEQQRVVVQGAGPALDAVAAPFLPADGSVALLVVRGTVPTGTSPPPPPAGPVELLGWLRASEPVEPSDLAGLEPGELPALSPVPYLADVDYSFADATLALAEQQPPSVGVTPLPAPSAEPTTRLNWRSLGYSLQWFILIGFIGFIWWRNVWRDPEATSHQGA